MNTAQTATAAFTPTQLDLTFAPSATPQTQMATFACPSNPNPTPANPCTDPNAHAVALTIPAVQRPFTVTVQEMQVPAAQANGNCETGNNVTNDFDCRFVSFFPGSAVRAANSSRCAIHMPTAIASTTWSSPDKQARSRPELLHRPCELEDYVEQRIVHPARGIRPLRGASMIRIAGFGYDAVRTVDTDAGGNHEWRRKRSRVNSNSTSPHSSTRSNRWIPESAAPRASSTT